jgi:hypothetical protein
MSASNQKPNDKAPRIAGRLSQYRRRQRLITWVGGGLFAEISVYTAVGLSSESSVPAVLTGVVPTFILVAGFLLAMARVRFEWRADLLERHLKMQTLKPDDLIHDIQPDLIDPNDLKWPHLGELFYQLELLFAFAGGIALMVLIWWSAYGTIPSP